MDVIRTVLLPCECVTRDTCAVCVVGRGGGGGGGHAQDCFCL